MTCIDLLFFVKWYFITFLAFSQFVHLIFTLGIDIHLSLNTIFHSSLVLQKERIRAFNNPQIPIEK